MTEKDIRPIPKYIRNGYGNLTANTIQFLMVSVRCYAYLTTWKNEAYEVTVAVKHRQKVVLQTGRVHGLDSISAS